MKVFLTGSTGFIGSHLAKEIAGTHDVTCLLSSSDLGMQKIPDGVKIEFCDLTNYSKIKEIISRTAPDAIIHLAAITPVRHSFEHPEIYQDVNYYATINLVHSAAKLPNFRKFIFASTMETYGWQKDKRPFTENLHLNPASPYAVSKVAAEKYIKMAGKALNFPYIIAKCCNTFGRKKEAGYIVEYLVTSMLKGEKVRIGTPDAVRDLMYVDDHVSAYLHCLKHELEPSAQKRIENIENDPNHYTFNFGWSSEFKIREIADKIKELIGYSGEITHGFPDSYPSRHVVEPYLSLNPEKARQILGWTPKIPLDEALKKTVEYWKGSAHLGSSS